MAITLDVSDDWRLWDNQFSVLYKSRNSDGTFDEFDITHAFQEQVNRKEIEASNGVYNSLDRAFNIPSVLLDEIKPKLGDRIVVNVDEDDLTNEADADPVEYRVLEAAKKVWGTDWRLICRDPIIAYQLTDTITVMRAVFAQDETKSRVPTFTASYSNISARMQEITGTSRDERGKRIDARQFEAYVADQLTVSADDRIVFENVIYEIVSWRNPERIDELMVITCELND